MIRNCEKVKYILFDYFGTVVNWNGTIVEEMKKIVPEGRADFDFYDFANRWHGEGYISSVFNIASGREPWRPVRLINYEKLNALLKEKNINLNDSEKEHLNNVWNRFKPWGDVVAGLNRLKARYFISPFTNGDLSIISNGSKYAGLPWDFILTGSMFQRYKPDPEIYKAVLSKLDIIADEVMLVASHSHDLNVAKSTGFHTAFVKRPLEYGPNGKKEQLKEGEIYDCVIESFLELSEKMGN